MQHLTNMSVHHRKNSNIKNKSVKLMRLKIVSQNTDQSVIV